MRCDRASNGTKATLFAGFWTRFCLPGALPLYLGDDVTDEDAFAVIPNGIAIHVGEPSQTCAAYWIPDLQAVRDFLLTLLELRPNAKTGP